ncbi:hypothetical protein J1N35_022261 [Gossypium stocksii]|uniref:RNase H type-1 domain-containing protein n=1 Tax=Gossypium stocksii TaxID=47602 RepID=A0A9D3VG46_9ROSI|nr:hypothetical protein J1N35_022261 [Gossypium stocksii]
MGFRRVEAESDNLMLISLIHKRPNGEDEAALMGRIRTLQTRSWIVTFKYVNREANRAADALAKMELYAAPGLSLFVDVPDVIEEELIVDRPGIAANISRIYAHV